MSKSHFSFPPHINNITFKFKCYSIIYYQMAVIYSLVVFRAIHGGSVRSCSRSKFCSHFRIAIAAVCT